MQPAAHPPTIYSLPSPSSASPTELCSIVIPEQEERLCLCGQPAPRGTPGRRHTPHQLSPEAPQLRGAGRRWCNPETLHCVARRSSRPVWPARARSRPGPRTSSSSSPTASPPRGLAPLSLFLSRPHLSPAVFPARARAEQTRICALLCLTPAPDPLRSTSLRARHITPLSTTAIYSLSAAPPSARFHLDRLGPPQTQRRQLHSHTATLVLQATACHRTTQPGSGTALHCRHSIYPAHRPARFPHRALRGRGI